MKKSLWLTLLAAVGLGAFAPRGLAQPAEYILHIISPFGPGTLNEAYAYDVNSSGQVVGYSSGSISAGFVWSPSTGAVQVSFGGVAIAEDGTYTGGSTYYAADGTVLGTIPPVDTFFTAIRPGAIVSGPAFPDGPIIVGRSFDPTVDPGPSSCFDCIAPAANSAFIFDPINGSRNLDALGVPDSYWARDLNGFGLIVGDTNDSGQEFNTRAFVFDLTTGVSIDLGTLRPDDLGIASAQGVNAAGQVCGFATSPTAGDEHAFIWTAADGLIDIGTLGADTVIGINRSRALGINAAGRIVGNSTSPDTVSPIAIRHPFIWDSVNGMRDLNDLVDLPANYELVGATAISDTGWICGYGVGSAGGGFTSAFVLEPIASGDPEFVRADCNDDGQVDVGDAIALLADLFVAAQASCQSACDANDDGAMDISDAINVLAVLFSGAGPVPAPSTNCGVDPTSDGLTCDTFSSCP